MLKRIFLTLFLVLLGSFISILLFKWQNKPPETFVSPVSTSDESNSYVPTQFSLEEAPTDSLRGEIVRMDGKIQWQSRVATEPAELKDKIVLQQGERLWMNEDSEMVMNFDQQVGLHMYENSEVELTQTLPLQLVFNQYNGEIDYVGTGSSPVSIRVGWLLVTLMKGSVSVELDSGKGVIYVDLNEGQATAAFNNVDYETEVIELIPGEEFEFDNVGRTIKG